MDLKYIITWIVVSFQTMPCPDSVRFTEMGVSSNISCMVNHVQRVEVKHEKAFMQKDSAVHFADRLKNFKHEGWTWPKEEILKVKLDSIPR